MSDLCSWLISLFYCTSLLLAAITLSLAFFSVYSGCAAAQKDTSSSLKHHASRKFCLAMRSPAAVFLKLPNRTVCTHLLQLLLSGSQFSQIILWYSRQLVPHFFYRFVLACSHQMSSGAEEAHLRQSWRHELVN